MTEPPVRYIAIGAHPSAETIREVEGVVAIPAAGVFISAVEIPADQSLADKTLIERVAEKRRELTTVGTFIAIRYGTTFRNETDADEKCRPFAARWKALLEECGDSSEVTLKVAGSKAGRPDPNRVKNGAEYLRELHRIRTGGSVDESFRRDVDSRFSGIASKSKWVSRHDGGFEFVALVKRDRMEDVAAAGEALVAAHPDTAFLLSGPWPLEVFADEG